MPWCPRCDEIFPDGSTCPRCRARLEAAEGSSATHALQPVDDLPQLKVPRRYRRAFDRLSDTKPPSQRVLIVAAAALVFAVGFLFGRVLQQSPAAPTVHALPPAVPLSTLDVDGSAAYLLWSLGERLATIATHDLYSGEVTPRARFTPPTANPDGHSRVSALGSDLALVLGEGRNAFVAVATAGGAPFGWIRGSEAAWEAPGSLLIRSADGRVSRWSSGSRAVVEWLPGTWSALLQGPTGAVLRRGDALIAVSMGGERPSIALPHDAKLLAVSADNKRAVLSQPGPAVWDGKTATPLRIQGYEAVAASFSYAGDKLAVLLRDSGASLVVGISDDRGNVSLKPVSAQSTTCASPPAWDSRGRWVFVAPGDGSVYAVEAAGGRVESVPTREVGCGLAWFAS